MKLILSPIESRRVIEYAFANTVLSVTVDGITDTFELPDADGTYDDFRSDVLPIMPVNRVTVAAGNYQAEVLSPHLSSPPARAVSYVTDEATGEEQAVPESDENYAPKLEAWKASLQRREVEI